MQAHPYTTMLNACSTTKTISTRLTTCGPKQHSKIHLRRSTDSRRIPKATENYRAPRRFNHVLVQSDAILASIMRISFWLFSLSKDLQLVCTKRLTLNQGGRKRFDATVLVLLTFRKISLTIVKSQVIASV